MSPRPLSNTGIDVYTHSTSGGVGEEFDTLDMLDPIMGSCRPKPNMTLGAKANDGGGPL